MTEQQQDFIKMARLAYRELTDQRPQWEARSPAMVADFEQLNKFLEATETVAARQGDKSAKDPTDARDQAEHAAEAAAGRLVRGLRVLQLSMHNPALATVATYTPDVLNPLHGEDLLMALNAVAAAASGDGIRELLLNEGLTDAHFQALDDAIALYEPLMDLNNSNVEQGKNLAPTAHQVVKGLRKVLQRIDTRIDNLRDDVPGLAAAYDTARHSAPSATSPREDGYGPDGGIGRETAGNAYGPEAQPGQ